MPNIRICSIPTCGKPCLARGMCKTHYRRWLKQNDPSTRIQIEGPAARFFREVVLNYTDDKCLIWPFVRNEWGRGVINYKSKPSIVPRVVCQIKNGPPPTPRHEAAHSCGKGHEGCCTPSHLSWKTRIENQADRLIHGTHNRGERCGNAKLTEADVHQIRMLEVFTSTYKIAIMFGITWSHARDIQLRKKWAWLD